MSHLKSLQIPIEFTTCTWKEKPRKPLWLFLFTFVKKKNIEISILREKYILRILFYCTRAAFTTLQAAAKGNPICKSFTACVAE